MPQAKAHALGKKGRKYAAAKKRREDPNPERSGPAKNVATKKKSNEGVQENMQANYKNYSTQDLLRMIKTIKRDEIGMKIIKAISNELIRRKEGVAEGSVTPYVNVKKIYDDGNKKEWHIYRGEEMIGYVWKNLPDTAEGLYIASGYGPDRGFTEEFTGLKSAVNFIASLDDQGVAEGFSDISGLMSASNLNNSYIITAELAEGGKKKFRVKAQNERFIIRFTQ